MESKKNILSSFLMLLFTFYHGTQAQISNSCGCGAFSICNSTENSAVTCNCLPGYVPLDQNDYSKGCHLRIAANYCPSSENLTVQEIKDVHFLGEGFIDLAWIESTDLQGCKNAIMEDCNLLAASLVNSTCHIKRIPFNGVKNASTKGITSLIKVAGVDKRISKKKKNFDAEKILKICLISSGCLAFMFGAVALYYHPASKRLLRRNKALDVNSIGVGFREFTFDELKEATDGFSIILGRGSSGKVYSGILRLEDSEIQVAVKRLERRMETSEKEFMTELKIIARSHHRNLARLLGFCVDNENRILVYEFMANGALSRFLSGREEKPGWDLRAEIAIGIAKGLLYLHEECETQIIHCDIKPENVLLDVNYTAKISDFGLSKLLGKDQTRTETGLRGTMGYLAPEWLKSAPVTTKVDIFSFGMMLFEIICCRRNVESNFVAEEREEEDDDDQVLAMLVLKSAMKGELELLAENDDELISDFERFKRMTMAGLWCIHPNPNLRPSMKTVTQMMEGRIDVEISPLLHDQMV